MTISSYWEKVEVFMPSEATYLILGREPEIRTSETLSSYQHLLRRLNRSFLDTCAHVRYCAERDLNPNQTSSWLSLGEEDDEFIPLASVDLLGLAKQLQEAKTRDAFVQYRYQLLYWLESAIDNFHAQKFGRVPISNWLYWTQTASAYSFDDIEIVTPEKRREGVRKLLLECGGNKSEVARKLGISRTRVDQLLLSAKDGNRKPFQLHAQDPFGLRAKPK
jgi:hypothetical protein